MKKSGSVAIIGAGLAGLSCAQALQAAGIAARIFERRADLGGRCATQLWQGHLVDIGIQYFTAQSGEFKKELLTRLRQFRPIVSPILGETGEAIPNACGPRFYVLQGNSYFAHVLSHGLDVRTKVEIGPVIFSHGGVKILNEPYRAVVSAAPGPETTRLFGLDAPPAEYNPCLVAILEYGGSNPGQSRECYGRILGERGTAVQASYCENNKVGRIVGNKTVFVVEATPQYSRDHAGAPPEQALTALIREHEEIWKIPAGNLTASFVHFWKYARPRAGTQTPVALPAGAFLCGDSRTEATVENVWLDGQRAAQEVERYFKQA